MKCHLTFERHYIKSGEVSIFKNSILIKKIECGFFIGELSFFKEDLANATVTVTSNEAEALIWSKDKLNKLELSDEELFTHFKHSMVLNLIKKLD